MEKPSFDIEAVAAMVTRFGHNGLLGLSLVAHGDDWSEMRLPYDPRLAMDAGSGILASGPIVSLMDMVTGSAVWIRRKRFGNQATLDLRIDYLRPAVAGRDLFGRGECYRVTRRVAFVRGQAHDGDPDDPVASVARNIHAAGRAMSDLPPYAALLGVRFEEDDGDAPLFVMPPGDAVVGRPGFLHGGAIAGLLEVAAYAAVRRAVAGEGVTIKPVTVTVDFMRGGRLTDTRARGRILRLGGRIASVEASAWQDDPAQPIGMARMTLMLRR